MGDWIHCNYCHARPGSKEKFFLASCGEIFCHKCLSESGDSVCRICKQQMQVMEINRQLKPEMQLYFLDIKEVMKRHHKQLVQIAEFQAKHRAREHKAAHDKLKKMGKMMAQFSEEMEKKAETEKNLEYLKNQYKRLYTEQKKTQMQLSHISQEHQKLLEHIDKQNRWAKESDHHFTLTSNEGPEEQRDMFGNRSSHHRGFPHTPTHNPISTSTPKNQILSAGRITLALKGGRNSGSGGSGGKKRTPSRHSPTPSITTPDILGIGRQEPPSKGYHHDRGNPYDGVWQGQNGSPIHISPRTVARSNFPLTGSIQQPPIRVCRISHPSHLTKESQLCPQPISSSVLAFSSR